jgi:hypothetical protein
MYKYNYPEKSICSLTEVLEFFKFRFLRYCAQFSISYCTMQRAVNWLETEMAGLVTKWFWYVSRAFFWTFESYRQFWLLLLELSFWTDAFSSYCAQILISYCTRGIYIISWMLNTSSSSFRNMSIVNVESLRFCDKENKVNDEYN